MSDDFQPVVSQEELDRKGPVAFAAATQPQVDIAAMMLGPNQMGPGMLKQARQDSEAPAAQP